MASWIQRRQMIIAEIAEAIKTLKAPSDEEYIPELCLRHGCSPRKAAEYITIARTGIKLENKQREELESI